MIIWLSNLLLKWSIKLVKYNAKLDGQIDSAFDKFDKEVERVKKDLKEAL